MVDAAACLQPVDVLSDEALVAARARLNPATGTMLRALWAADSGQLALIIHHLAVDGVSWRILLEDLNIAWAQHHHSQPMALPAGGTSFARWSSLLDEHARHPHVVAQADTWKQVAAAPAGCPRCNLSGIPTPAPGICRCRWIARPPGCCSVRCPRRFMPGYKTSC